RDEQIGSLDNRRSGGRPQLGTPDDVPRLASEASDHARIRLADDGIAGRVRAEWQRRAIQIGAGVPPPQYGARLAIEPVDRALDVGGQRASPQRRRTPAMAMR